MLKDKFSFFKFSTLLLITLLFSACSQEGSTPKPSYTGRPGELLIVCPNNYWQGDLGDSILYYLQPNFPMLPQAEAVFNLVHFEEDKLNQLLSRHRNILKIEIDPSKEEGLSNQPSKEAKGQVHITLHAKNATNAVALVKEASNSIINQIRLEERHRYQNWLALHPEKEIEKQIQDTFGYKVTIPFGTELIEIADDFVRLKWEREKILSGTKHFMEIGIVLYKSNYYTDTIFTQEGLTELRNRELKRIPGPKEGSHMALQSFISPEVLAVNPNPGFQYAMELRGLWRTTESFIGGPFVSLSQLDEEKAKVITVEAFVLAPKFDKREFMKEAEALVYSLSK